MKKLTIMQRNFNGKKTNMEVRRKKINTEITVRNIHNQEWEKMQGRNWKDGNTDEKEWQKRKWKIRKNVKETIMKKMETRKCNVRKTKYETANYVYGDTKERTMIKRRKKIRMKIGCKYENDDEIKKNNKDGEKLMMKLR